MNCGVTSPERTRRGLVVDAPPRRLHRRKRLGGARVVNLVGVEAQREAEVALARRIAARARVEAEATARAASLAQHKLHQLAGRRSTHCCVGQPRRPGRRRRHARAASAARLRARRAAARRGLAPQPRGLGCLAQHLLLVARHRLVVVAEGDCK